MEKEFVFFAVDFDFSDSRRRLKLLSYDPAEDESYIKSWLSHPILLFYRKNSVWLDCLSVTSCKERIKGLSLKENNISNAKNYFTSLQKWCTDLSTTRSEKEFRLERK